MNVDEQERSTKRPRVRLVPPRLGEIERRTRGEPGAQRWTRGLRADQRRRAVMVFGNLLLLAVLVGVPFVRGHWRALETQGAHAAFVGCLYGGRVSGGLGALAQEEEHFAAQLARAERDWPRRCMHLLDALAPRPALFVLPAVKAAEERVREAHAIARSELQAVQTYRPGQRMPERALRALQLLRSSVGAQQVQAGVSSELAELPARLDRPAGLAMPARLPLYAAPDASLTLWGDDQVLRIVAVDATGLSYFEAQAGKPFVRARLARPSSLRGYAQSGAHGWLVWGTPAARCAQRGDGCFGKTSRVAEAPAPLLELPPARTLNAHLAGRADRALAATPEGVLLAARAAGGRTELQEFALLAQAEHAELPALSATRSWPARLDDALVLATNDGPLVLGITRAVDRAQLLHVRARASTPLAELAGTEPVWLAACAEDRRVTFAFGAAGQLRIGMLESASKEGGRSWAELTLPVTQVIDGERRDRDRVALVCKQQGALLIAHEADDRLTAIACDESAQQCRKLHIASEVAHFSTIATSRGALIAYAGAQAAQVRVRTFDSARVALGPERIPSACWSKRGLCAKPSLARVGARIVLVAPEKTDLLALESADDGETWSTPPTL
jgi:hypothetical protein